MISRSAKSIALALTGAIFIRRRAILRRRQMIDFAIIALAILAAVGLFGLPLLEYLP